MDMNDVKAASGVQRALDAGLFFSLPTGEAIDLTEVIGDDAWLHWDTAVRLRDARDGAPDPFGAVSVRDGMVALSAPEMLAASVRDLLDGGAP